MLFSFQRNFVPKGKDLADRDDLGELAAFGSVVLGIDEGDGHLAKRWRYGGTAGGGGR